MKKGLLLFVLCCMTTLVSAQVVRNDTTYHTICAGESYEWENNNYNQHGCYDEIYTAVDGADSVVTLHLTVLPVVPVTADTITLCYGDSCTWQGHVYTASGDYADTLQTLEFGCDSIVTLQLTILPEVAKTTESATICYGESYMWQGNAYATSGNYSWTLQDVNGCDSVVMLDLTVLPAVPITNEIATICHGESYMWQGNVYMESVVDTVVLKDVNGCDSMVVLSLTVLPIAYTTEDVTIIDGETYMWHEEAYKIAGTYVDTLKKSDGCDSIVTLSLKVLGNDVVVHAIQPMELCADEGIIEMSVEWEGWVDSVALQFVRDTLDTIAIGLHDTIVPMPADGYLSIPYAYIRAGVYEANVIGSFCQNKVFESKTSMTFLYPSSVLEQRWDDVICVLTSGYNGGYDFVAFQWYKDGQPIEGENNYYLTQPLEDGAEYSVLLTESDSTQLMSCPLMIGIKEDSEVTVEPTLITNKQLVRCVVPDVATIYVYDMTGQIVRNDILLQGETYIQMPYLPGIYMVKVLLKTGDMSDFKIVVL